MDLASFLCQRLLQPLARLLTRGDGGHLGGVAPDTLRECVAPYAVGVLGWAPKCPDLREYAKCQNAKCPEIFARDFLAKVENRMKGCIYGHEDVKTRN